MQRNIFLFICLFFILYLFGVVLVAIGYAQTACPSGFKTQDYSIFANPTPKFTILIPNNASSCNGKTGISFNTAGLFVSVRVDNQSAGTVYRSSDSNIQTIPTLGLYQTPTSGKIRLREVDAVNQPGVLEIQLPKNFFQIPNSRRVDLCVGGVTDTPNPICEKIYIVPPSSHCSGGC